MPKRSRTHQLEDASIKHFEKMVPEQWVCRRKDKDYGVDLEVEIFDSAGEATGLLFYVQLKATDDIKSERSVSMKVDRLQYLASFDSPSIVVRYCDASKAIYWIWITNIFAKKAEQKTENLNVQFDESDRWSDSSPLQIVETLKVFRTIRQSSRRTPVGLVAKSIGPNDQSRFELDHAISKIKDSSKMVTFESDGSKCLPITVWLEGEYLVAVIDVISSIKLHLKQVHRETIFEQLTYILAYMAIRYEFSTQARDFAQIIFDRTLVCQSRELAGSLASMIVENSFLAAEIASLNQLHAQQDLAYSMYIHSLLQSETPAETKAEAVKRFYSEAISSHETQSLHSQSVIHYSYGNFLRIIGELFPAIRHYNLARKKNPEYLKKDYFLGELASSLYFKDRLPIAGRLYAASFEITQSYRVALAAGDAFLFSGNFEKASKYFSVALNSKDEFEVVHAAIKKRLISWCADQSARSRTAYDRNSLRKISYWAEATDHHISEGEFLDALGACLMLSFLAESEEKAWTRAIEIAFRVQDTEFLTSSISCAVWYCGYEAYAPFRDKLLEGGVDAVDIQTIDEIVSRLYALRTSAISKGVTSRVFKEHHFDTSVEVFENDFEMNEPH